MNIVVKCMAGSHLFGTNTPQSDKDYKGVYLPCPKDILLGTVKNSLNLGTNKTNVKNTSEDIDVEYYSLKKFMNMLYEGQTVALELLWTPEEYILESTPLWEEIQSHRYELTHKKVTAFVGYCKTQADKYGVKGSRMAACKSAIDYLQNCLRSYGDIKIGHENIWHLLTFYFKDTEHIEFGEQEFNKKTTRYIEICDRKFQETVRVEYALAALDKLYANYGDRAKKARDNKGIDWKALSHAYRVCTQAIELLETGKMTLPLPDESLKIVRAIKLGELSFDKVRPMLEAKVEQVTEMEAQSHLQSEMNYKTWCEDFVVKKYMGVVNEA